MFTLIYPNLGQYLFIVSFEMQQIKKTSSIRQLLIANDIYFMPNLGKLGKFEYNANLEVSKESIKLNIEMAKSSN